MLNVTATSAVTGAGAHTIVPASGDSSVTRHIKKLVITTASAAAGTLTLTDGVTSIVLNYPDAATAPPFLLELGPIPALKANSAWTLTLGTTTNSYNVVAVWSEDPRDIV